MSPKVERLKAELLTTKFTREELEGLFAIIQLKLGNVRAQIKVDTETADGGNQLVSLLYVCLAELYLDRLGERVPTLGETRARNAKIYNDLVTCATALEKFAKQNLPKVSRIQTTALFKLYLRLAYESCRAIGGILTPSRILVMHDRCGTLIDDQFPGYLSAKLLHVALNGTASRFR